MGKWCMACGQAGDARLSIRLCAIYPHDAPQPLLGCHWSERSGHAAVAAGPYELSAAACRACMPGKRSPIAP